MALIKRADADRMARQALVLDLGDLVAEGERVKADARKEAERLVIEGRAERERLIADAREKGHAEGYAKGHAEGHAKGVEEGIAKALAQHASRIDALLVAWSVALEQFAGERAALIESARRHVLELAIAIASRIVKRVAAVDPEVVVRQIDEVLQIVLDPSRLRISVHPDDLAAAAAALPALMARFGDDACAQVAADSAVERGACIVRTAEGGLIDAGLSTQLDRLVQVLLPHESGGGSS